MPDTAPPADGSVLTSSWLQTMVREQVVRTVTSSTRPSAVEGMLYYETDTDRLMRYDGTGHIIMGEPEQSYTPSWSGITVGNGTNTGTYHREDGYCHWQARLVFGTTTSVSGAANVSFPINIGSGSYGVFLTAATYHDASAAAEFPLVSRAATTTSTDLGFGPLSASGSYVSSVAMSATVPVAYGSTDVIEINGRFKMTTKYS